MYAAGGALSPPHAAPGLQLVAEVLPEELQGAAEELSGYLADSFGNATRIDYGTGHETTFCALLYCLAKLGVVGRDDAQALVTRVFARYLQLMRKIQVGGRPPQCACGLSGGPARLHPRCARLVSRAWAWLPGTRCAAAACGSSTCLLLRGPPPHLPADHLLAGAGGQPRRVGPGRLSVPALCVGLRAGGPGRRSRRLAPTLPPRAPACWRVGAVW